MSSERKIKIVILAGILAIIAISVTLVKQIKSGDISTYKISASYAININNPCEVVGDADYVFVGKVASKLGTDYLNKFEMNGRYVGDAYTKYSVQVLANIKNALITDKNIVLSKFGGIREDESAYDIMEDDFLPQDGQIYVFIANTQDDGSLLVSGANSNILFTEKASALSSVDKIANTSIYKQYENAVANKVLSDPDMLSSKYDNTHRE